MNDLAVIHLTNGGFTVIDSEDVEKVSSRPWRHNSKGHIIHQWWDRDTPKKWTKLHTEWMHRTINNTPVGVETDHRNGVKFDNRKCNLRDATHSANNANKPKPALSNPVSVFKGVSLNRKSRIWSAKLRKDGRNFIVCRHTELEAAIAYNALAVEHFGEYARLNPL